MKIVLDTNVLVSGLLQPLGPSAQIVRLVAAEELVLCYDPRILAASDFDRDGDQDVVVANCNEIVEGPVGGNCPLGMPCPVCAGPGLSVLFSCPLRRHRRIDSDAYRRAADARQRHRHLLGGQEGDGLLDVFVTGFGSVGLPESFGMVDEDGNPVIWAGSSGRAVTSGRALRFFSCAAS